MPAWCALKRAETRDRQPGMPGARPCRVAGSTPLASAWLLRSEGGTLNRVCGDICCCAVQGSGWGVARTCASRYATFACTPPIRSPQLRHTCFPPSGNAPKFVRVSVWLNLLRSKKRLRGRANATHPPDTRNVAISSSSLAPSRPSAPSISSTPRCTAAAPSKGHHPSPSNFRKHAKHALGTN